VALYASWRKLQEPGNWSGFCAGEALAFHGLPAATIRFFQPGVDQATSRASARCRKPSRNRPASCWSAPIAGQVGARSGAPFTGWSRLPHPEGSGHPEGPREPGISRYAARAVLQASSPRAARRSANQGTAESRRSPASRPASLAGSANRRRPPCRRPGERPVAGKTPPPETPNLDSPTKASGSPSSGTAKAPGLHRVEWPHQHGSVSVAGLFQGCVEPPQAAVAAALAAGRGRGR